MNAWSSSSQSNASVAALLTRRDRRPAALILGYAGVPSECMKPYLEGSPRHYTNHAAHAAHATRRLSEAPATSIHGAR